MRNDISYLRAYAIVTVVLWHCFFCPYLVNTWFDNVSIPASGIYRCISGLLIVDASMPLFTFISGFLFYYLYNEKNRYRNGNDFFLKKIKRLVVPFIVLGIIINLTTIPKYNDVTNIFWGYGSHMWYAIMLFWCFAIGWTLQKLNNRYITISAIVFCLFYIFSKIGVYQDLFVFKLIRHPLPLGLHNAFNYFFYFYMGGIVCRYKGSIDKYLLTYRKITMLVALYLTTYIVSYTLDNEVIYIIDKILRTCLFSFILYLIIGNLCKNGVIRKSSFVNELGAYGFGIYVYHHWIAWNVIHIPEITIVMKQYYIIFPIVFSFSVFLLSFYLTKWSLRTKIGRFFLAG